MEVSTENYDGVAVGKEHMDIADGIQTDGWRWLN